MTDTRSRPIALAYFRKEDYQRIREISADEMQPTFEAFEAKIAKAIPQLAAQGIVFEKVMLDPDDLLAFAKANFGGRIDTNVRSAFAARIVAEKYDSRH